MFSGITGMYSKATGAYGGYQKVIRTLETLDHEPTELLDNAVIALRELLPPIRESHPISPDTLQEAIRLLEALRTYEKPEEIFTNAESPESLELTLELVEKLEKALRHCQYTHFGAQKTDYVDLSTTLVQTLQALESEWSKQAGYVKKTITAGARNIHEQWDRLFTGRSSPHALDTTAEAATSQHPLMQLSCLMGNLKSLGERTLPTKAEEDLWSAIKTLELYSDRFKGIEARIREQFEARKLFENLLELYVFLSEYTVTEILKTEPSAAEEADNSLWEVVFKVCKEQKQINHSKAKTLLEKANKGFEFVRRKGTKDSILGLFAPAESSPEGHGESSSRSDSPRAETCEPILFLSNLEATAEVSRPKISEKQAAFFHMIWTSVAQYEELVHMRRLHREIIGARCENPADFFANLEAGIAFYEKSPQLFWSSENLAPIERKIKEWFSFATVWVKGNVKYGKREPFDKQIHLAARLLSLGDITGALQLVRATFEKSEMALDRWPKKETLSPGHALGKAIETFTALAPHKAVRAVTRDDIERERSKLITNASYFATFAFFERTCQIVDPKRPETQVKAERLYQEGMTAARAERGSPEKQKEAFFRYLSNQLNTDEELKLLSPLRRGLIRGVMPYVHLVVSFLGEAFSKDFVDYFHGHITLSAKKTLTELHLRPVVGSTRALEAYRAVMNEWQKGAVRGTREEALAKIAENPEYTMGIQPGRIGQLAASAAIDKFLSVIKICRVTDEWKQRISDFVNAPTVEEIAEDSVFNSVGYGFKYIFSYVPSIGVEVIHRVLSLFEVILNSLIKRGVKWYLSTQNITKSLSKKANESLSQRAQLLEILLEQLTEIERRQETEKEMGDAELIEHEHPTTKARLGEMIQLLFEVTDQNQFLTSSSMESRPSDTIPFLDEHTRKLVTNAFNENLRNAFVTLIIVISQSLLTEEHMNDLFLKVLEKGNAGLTHQDRTLTQEEEEALAQERRKLVEALTTEEKQGFLKAKHAQTLDQIRDSLGRIVRKSVGPIIDRTVERVKMSPSVALMNCLDWMEKYFFQTDASQKNIFTNLQDRLRLLNEEVRPGERHQILHALHREFLGFLRQFKGHQRMLDRNPTHNILMLNRLNNQLLPDIVQIQEALEALLKDGNNEKIPACQLAIQAFQERLEREHVFHQLQAVKRAEEGRMREESHDAVGKAKQGFHQVVDLVAPAGTEGITNLVAEMLSKRTDGMLHLLHCSSLVNLTLNHEMLVFCESQGYVKV